MEEQVRRIGLVCALDKIAQEMPEEKPGSSAAKKLMLAMAALPAFALARRGVSRYLGRKFPKIPPPPKV